MGRHFPSSTRPVAVAPGRSTRQGPGALAVAAVVCVGYGTVVASTRPFSAGADVVVAVALAAAAAVAAWRAVVDRPRHGGGGEGVAGDGPARRPVRVGRGGRRVLVAWGAVVAGAVALELFSYTHGPRAAYPTLSSLLDSLDAGRLGKTVAGAAWLALGWWLVDR